MKSMALGFFAIALLGAGAREVPYEPLVIVSPQPQVVRAAEESALVDDINRFRANRGLPPMAVDERLTRAALAHARDMAERKYFGHDAPDGTSLPDRLKAVGFPWSVAAENIALAPDEHQANAELVESPAHRENILDPQVRKIGVAALGVGVDAVLYVEDFAL
jgi:uncharacterized protein YkwD